MRNFLVQILVSMIPLATLEFKLLMCSDPVGLFSAFSAKVMLMHFSFLALRMSSLLFDDIQLSYCTFNWMVSLITVAVCILVAFAEVTVFSRFSDEAGLDDTSSAKVEMG